MATIDRISKQVGSAMKRAGMTKPATLIVVTAGTRTYASGGTSPTTADVKARGLVVQWKRKLLNTTLIQSTDRVVALFGALIAGGAVPKINDKVTIEGETGTIVDIERDAASACYNCLTRT